MEALKTLIESKGISLSVGKADSGQTIGQGQTEKSYDLELQDSSPTQQNMCGRRLVWFRTLAFQANDPGFKSRRPHQTYPSLKRIDCCFEAWTVFDAQSVSFLCLEMQSVILSCWCS